MRIPDLKVNHLLHQFGLQPDKRLGQNFLVASAILERIIAAAEISNQDAVLEIGPGLGSLTRYLATHARKVVAVELDNRLLDLLEFVLASYSNVNLIQGDILNFDPGNIMDTPGYLVVANIPYYITSALLRHLLEAKLQPKRMVLTVQYEVALRICAVPNKMNLLALSVQVYGKPQVITRIPAEAFYPPPKVDSAVVRIDLFQQPFITASRLEAFFGLTKAGFGQKRKTLRNALVTGLGWTPTRVEMLLLDAGIDGRRRAETFSLEEWARLVEVYSAP